MTVYAYDTEFLEDGRTIELISIGIACEDGREYYAVNVNADWERIRDSDWLVNNVLPSLPFIDPDDEFSDLDRTDVAVKPLWVIANEVREFLLSGDTPPQLWADYAAYDHVALCQLWGRMIDLPEGIPMFTHDLQYPISVNSYNTVGQESGQHNALEDARHVMRVLRLWRFAR